MPAIRFQLISVWENKHFEITVLYTPQSHFVKLPEKDVDRGVVDVEQRVGQWVQTPPTS